MQEKYRKVRKLGTGATSEVYQVEEVATGQYYAMKISENEELLRSEATFLQELKSPFFPYLKEYFTQNRGYMIVEYIEGNNLQELLDKGKHFSDAEIVYIMDELLKGLSYLHLHTPSIIYRDLKPANIMIDKEGRIRLIDLGTACYQESVRKTEKGRGGEGTMAGTYGYAAPEQFWSGVKLDTRCDIYAAGKVFAYLVSKKNPAEPPYDMEHFCKELRGLPEEFMEIIERSLAIEPQARFEDCESMRREIHVAYEKIATQKRLFKIHKKSKRTYIKCIWLSEYRRIF